MTFTIPIARPIILSAEQLRRPLSKPLADEISMVLEIRIRLEDPFVVLFVLLELVELLILRRLVELFKCITRPLLLVRLLVLSMLFDPFEIL